MVIEDKDLRRLRDAAAALVDITTPSELPRRTLAVVGELVPSDVSSYELVTEAPANSTYVHDPTYLEFDHEAFVASLADHPLVRLARSSTDLSVRRMSDVIDRRAFHRLAIYNDVLRPLGLEEQMALSSPAGPRAVFGLALNRSQGAFTDRERLLLELLGPAVLGSRRQSRLRSLASAAIEAEERHAERTGIGVVLVDRRGGVRLVTPRAEVLLAQVGEGGRGTRSRLPERIAEWVRSQVREAPFVGAGRGVQRATRIRGDEGFIEAEFVPARSERESHAVLLWQESGAPLKVISRPLTPRQHEVFAHLARGLTDKQIAKALGLSVRTVQKHLERGYRTLGVRSRGEAISRLLGVPSDPDATNGSVDLRT